MNKKDIRYFSVAKAVSKTSDYGRINIGCCIVKRKDIVSVAANLKKSHPLQEKLNKDCRGFETKGCIHAELLAIIKSSVSLEGAILYVYREDRNGNIANCRPCRACMSAIKQSGIREINYTDKTYVKELISG